MDARIFARELEKSIALIGENPNQREHIAKELGLERNVFFVTHLVPHELEGWLDYGKHLYMPAACVTPAKKIVRDSFGNEAPATDPQYIAFFKDQTEKVIARAFPTLTVPQRLGIPRFYSSRFELYASRDQPDNTEFLKATVRVIDFLAEHNISFALPSAIGSNQRYRVDVAYAFFAQGRNSQSVLPAVWTNSSDKPQPFTAPALTYGLRDNSDVPQERLVAERKPKQL